LGVLLVCGSACPGNDGGSDDADGSTTSTTSQTSTSTAGTDDTTAGSDTSTGGSSTGLESSTGTLMVDYAMDVQPIFNGNCLCHMQNSMGVMTAPILTLNEGMSHGQLVSTASEQVPSMNRVEPGDPDNSYLWHKLQGTHLDAGGSGTMMPQTGELTDGALAIIEAWIASGAEP
jgi:hypothetical protein